MRRSNQAAAEGAAREACVRVCRLIYERSYSTGADGNVSVRLPNGTLLVTPSGAHKGFLGPEDLVLLAPDGRPLGEGVPTSELPMHLAVHRTRPDVRAVVHAHPVSAVACSIAGIDLAEIVGPEVVFGVGSIRWSPTRPPPPTTCPRRWAR